MQGFLSVCDGNVTGNVCNHAAAGM